MVAPVVVLFIVWIFPYISLVAKERSVDQKKQVYKTARTEESIDFKILNVNKPLESAQVQKQHEINNFMPSSLIKAPREGASVILVEKDSQTLWLYTFKNGFFLKKLEIPCSTGEVDGPKSAEGDKKTPEGIYFLKKIYQERFLAPIYGKRAFTTDYPNHLDKMLGKTGSAIWLHGTNKRLKPMDSNGCVAMNNDDVIKLDPYVVLDETPVIIMDRVDYSDPESNSNQRAAVLDFLSNWIESLNKGSYLEYLFHYSSDYLPDVRWWAEWLDIRFRTALAGNPILARFDYVGIYRHKNHFVVLLDFEVSSRYRTIAVGRRKLFIIPPNNITLRDLTHKNKEYIQETGIHGEQGKSSQRDYMIKQSSYSNHSYKIIGDIFQTVVMPKSGANNLFITAAAQLDGQLKTK